MQQTDYSTPSQSSSLWLKYLVIGGILLLDFYLVFLMYSQGEYLFALLTLVILTSGIYIFSSKKVYAWRYVYRYYGDDDFILFPLVATIAIAFTNYSGTNQLAFERALNVLRDQHYFSGDKFDFKLYPQADNRYILSLHNNNSAQDFVSESILLSDEQVNVSEQPAPTGKVAPLKVITQNRAALQKMTVLLPNGNALTMSSLRQFSEQKARYQYDEESQILTNNENGKRYRANNDIGFFQTINANGDWEKETLEPLHRLYRLS